MTFPARRLLLAGLAAALLAGCGKEAATPTGLAVDFDRDTACSLDGMLLADYPGPKAQILYEGETKPDFFCDTVEMFSVYLNPEQARRVKAIYVQDMAQADWDAPRGHWTDARSASYVIGSKRQGSMGPTIASFARDEDARRFASEEGGRVLKFAEVKPDMVVLDGGAQHDAPM